MLADHPTHTPQPHHLHHESPEQERHPREAHGLVCRPDRVEALEVPASGLRDPLPRG
jgi:hypothetical protein